MTATDSLIPLDQWTDHAYPEADRVAQLAASMTQSGWIGAPILTVGDLAITGTHRIAAARASGVDVETLDLADVTIETVGDIIDLVRAETGVDIDTLDAARVAFARALTTEQVEQYGLDTEQVAWILDILP
jgi:ParB-like chromosome segregation protein Spo0J